MATEQDYIMVEFDGNWADEFDMRGYWFTSREKYEKYLEEIKAFNEFPHEQYFGTNEAMIWESLEDYTNCLGKPKKVSAEEMKIVAKLFDAPNKKNFTVGDFFFLDSNYS
jgi:hypothetical protein